MTPAERADAMAPDGPVKTCVTCFYCCELDTGTSAGGVWMCSHPAAQDPVTGRFTDCRDQRRSQSFGCTYFGVHWREIE